VIETPSEEVIERERGEFVQNEQRVREPVEHLKNWIQLQLHLPKESGTFLPQESSRSRVSTDSLRKTNTAPTRHKINLRAVHKHVAACILWRCSSTCGLHNGGSTNCSSFYVTRHTTSQAALDTMIYRASV